MPSQTSVASKPAAKATALISCEELVPGAQEQREAFRVGPVDGSGNRIDLQVSGGRCVPPALVPLCISARCPPGEKVGFPRACGPTEARSCHRMVWYLCALGCACVRADRGPGCSVLPSGLCFLGAKAIGRPFTAHHPSASLNGRGPPTTHRKTGDHAGLLLPVLSVFLPAPWNRLNIRSPQ